MAGAGYLLYTAGQILTAAQVNTYLMQQSAMVFATSAARDSALTSVKSEGNLTYQLDANSFTVYSGSAWSTVGPMHGAWTVHVPTWTNLTVGNGVLSEGGYQRIGRTIIYKVMFTFGTTTSVSGAITLNVPFACGANLSEFACESNVMFYDSSATFRYVGFTTGVSTTTLKLTSLSGTRRDLDTSSTSPFTWATSDIIFLKITYEAAADA